ncbi:MAG TPA: helix-turn-helix transcriptional regulator [Candidatus Eremiobacteraceae bacterium]|nr:helix-turn-helix transcriptional regulator [Candidatus Eremiobacteraceae bacterium]
MSAATQPDPYEAVGRSIAARRNAVGMSQAILASAIGLTRTSVSNIEVGRQKLLLHTFLAICIALKMKPNDLLPWLDETYSSASDEQLIPRNLSPTARASILTMIQKAKR